MTAWTVAAMATSGALASAGWLGAASLVMAVQDTRGAGTLLRRSRRSRDRDADDRLGDVRERYEEFLLLGTVALFARRSLPLLALALFALLGLALRGYSLLKSSAAGTRGLAGPGTHRMLGALLVVVAWEPTLALVTQAGGMRAVALWPMGASLLFVGVTFNATAVALLVRTARRSRGPRPHAWPARNDVRHGRADSG